MNLHDLMPDPEALVAMEPDELGLRMLLALRGWPQHEELMLESFTRSVVGDPGLPSNHPASASPYPHQHRAEIKRAVREAWFWLEGQALLIESPRHVPGNRMRNLSRRALRLAEEPDARRVFSARRLPKETLHPSIREDVWALYHRGKYDTAVSEAMKAVEVAVRGAADLKAKDIGAPLMRKAFDPKTGPLADMGVDEGEREARAHLFAGAIGSYKNPHSHRYVALDDPDEAAEIIMLANHLLRIVDSRREARE